MKDSINTFETLLNEEDLLLDSILDSQKELHESISNKNWEKLTKVISKINLLSDEFQAMDEKREVLQSNLSKDELYPFFDKMGKMRGKLNKSKIENEALAKYLTITKGFVQGVIDKVLPQNNKVYTKQGIVQSQIQGVVLNELF